MYALDPPGIAARFATKSLMDISLPGTNEVLALQRSSVLFAIVESRYAERKEAHIKVTAATVRVCILDLDRLIRTN